MNKSECIKNLSAALAKFHETMEPIVKDSENPHFRSKFVSLDAMLLAIKKPLATAGLTFAQFPSGLNGLSTILMHAESGEWIEERYEIPLAKNDPQGAGSALTYMRRYSLGAMLGLATEEDDDANSASAPSYPRGKAVNDDGFTLD